MAGAIGNNSRQHSDLNQQDGHLRRDKNDYAEDRRVIKKQLLPQVISDVPIRAVMISQMLETMSSWKGTCKDAWIFGVKHFDIEQKILILNDPPHLSHTQR